MKKLFEPPKHPYTNASHMISVEAAEAMLGDWKYVYNRDIIPSKVVEILQMYQDGKWHLQAIIILYVRSTKSYVLVDGQHRLKALVMLGRPHMMQIQINEVEDVPDIHEGFLYVDRGGFRAPATAIAPSIRDKYDMSSDRINKVISAGLAIESEYNPMRLPTKNLIKVKAACFERYAEAAQMFFSVTSGRRTSAKVAAQWVMAVALPTIADPSTREHALAFWEDVSMDGMGGDIAAYQVSTFLWGKKPWEGRDAKLKGARLVAALWNASIKAVKPKTAIGHMKISLSVELAGVDGRYYTTMKGLALLHSKPPVSHLSIAAE